MKPLFFFIISLCFWGCQKETATVTDPKESINNDSIIVLLNHNWKFKSPNYSDDVYYVLNNWDDWREMVNQLENKPAKSINAYQKKVKDLVVYVDKLPFSLPEKFKNQAILSRINLLKTHIYQLDMLMELNPLPHKEITPLLVLIQKDLSSISNQFQEIFIKNKIPKEAGEDAVRVNVDTVKRATLNAIPTE